MTILELVVGWLRRLIAALFGGTRPGPTNRPPSLRLDASLHGRLVSPVSIAYVLADVESDTVSVDLEYSLDGTQFSVCTAAAGSGGLAQLSSSPAGVPHRFLWDAGRDLSLPHAGVWLRARASDGSSAGPATLIAGLEIVAVAAPATGGAIELVGPRAGAIASPVPVHYLVIDEHLGLHTVRIQYSIDGGATFRTATRATTAPSARLDAVASSGDGREHRFLWDAHADLGASSTATLRVELDGTSVATSDVLTVAAGGAPPAISSLDVTGDVRRGVADVRLALASLSASSVQVALDYSLDAGATFQSTATTPRMVLAESAPRDHVLRWDFRSDTGERELSGAIVRVVARNEHGTASATSGPFDVRVELRAQITRVISGSGPEVLVEYLLLDPLERVANVELEWSTDHQQFYPATEHAGAGSEGRVGLASSHVGRRHRFVWSAIADAGAGARVVLRVSPRVGAPGRADTVGPFSIGTRPIVDVAIGPPAAGVPVVVRYVVTDADAAPFDLDARYSLDGVTFHPATEATGHGSSGTTGLSSHALGEPHVFVWDAASDIGGPAAGVYLELATSTGGRARLGPFDARPQHAPRVRVLDPARGRWGAPLPVRLVVTSATSQPIDLVADVSTDGGTSYRPATDAGTSHGSAGLVALTSSATGEEHVFVWDAARDLDERSLDDVRLRLRPAGAGEGDTVGPGRVALPEVPRIEIDVPLAGEVASPVDVRYRIFDAEGDACDVDVGYSLDGTTWHTATESVGAGSEGTRGLTSWWDGEQHRYTWDSVVDLGEQGASSVRLRIVPRAHREGPAAVSPAFSVARAGRSTVTLLEPAVNTTAGSPVAIRFITRDPGFVPVDVDAVFSTDGGATFRPMTEAPGHGSEGTTGLAASSAGIPHLFVWDASSDLGGAALAAAIIRIDVHDRGGAASTPAHAVSVSATAPGASPVPDVYTGSTPAMAEITAIDYTRYTITKHQGDRQTVTSGFLTPHVLRAHAVDEHGRLADELLDWRVVEDAAHAPIQLVPELFDTSFTHGVSFVHAAPGLRGTRPARVEVSLRANPAVRATFDLTVEPPALRARGDASLNFADLDPASPPTLRPGAAHTVAIEVGPGFSDGRFAADLTCTSDELWIARARVIATGPHHGFAGPTALVSFVALPPPPGQLARVARLRVAYTADPHVSLEVVVRVAGQLNAFRHAPAFSGVQSRELSLLLRPQLALPAITQIGRPGEALQLPFSVRLEDHEGQAYAVEATGGFEGCTVEPTRAAYRVSWSGPGDLRAATAPFVARSIHPELGDPVSAMLPADPGAPWPTGPQFVTATITGWAPEDPQRRAFRELDSAGNEIRCVRYNTLGTPGSRLTAHGFAFPVDIVQRAEALRVAIDRLGSYGMEWLHHRGLPYLADDRGGAPGAELLVVPSTGGGVDRVPIGRKVHVTFTIQEGLAFDPALAVRAYLDPDRTTWQDHTGAPVVTIDPARPHEAVVEIDSAQPIYALHLMRITYRQLGALKGRAVAIQCRYRIVETGVTTTTTTTALEVALAPIVNLLVHPRDMGDATPSRGYSSLSPSGDHHNVCTGNVFVQIPIVSTYGRGENTNLALSYNSDEAVFRAAVDQLRHTNHLDATTLEMLYGTQAFVFGWTHSYAMCVREHRLPSATGALDFLVDVVGPDGNRILMRRATAEPNDPNLGLGEYVPLHADAIWAGSAELGHCLRLRKKLEHGQLRYELLELLDRRWTFDGAGRLVEISDPTIRGLGARLPPLTVTHGHDGIKVTDSAGRQTRIHHATGIIDTPDGLRTIFTIGQSLAIGCDRAGTSATANAAQFWSFSYERMLFPPMGAVDLLTRLIDPVRTLSRYYFYAGDAFEGVPRETARAFWGRLGTLERSAHGGPVVERRTWRYRAARTDGVQEVVYRNPVGTELVVTYRTDLLGVVSEAFIVRDRDPVTGELLATPSYSQVLAGGAMPATQHEAARVFHEDTKLVATDEDLHRNTTTFEWMAAPGIAHGYQLQRVTCADGAVAERSYDAERRLERIYSPGLNRRGDKFSVFTYDAHGRLESKTLPVLDRTYTESWTYDAASGLPLTHVTPDGTTWTLGHGGPRDPGTTRLPTSRSVTIDGVTLTWETTYDVVGRVVETFEPLHGGVESFTYNRLGLLVTTRRPAIATANGGETCEVRNIYDAMGRPRAVIDPEIGAERLDYDINGRVISRRITGGGQVRWVRRADGSISELIDQAGGTTKYVRDELGRVIAELPQAPDDRAAPLRSTPSRIVTAYDDVAGQYVQQRCEVGGAGTALFEVTSKLKHGRLESEARRMLPDGETTTVTHTYDAWGNPLVITTAHAGVEKRKVTYAYDDWGRRSGETDEADGASEVSSWTLDANGERLLEHGPNVSAYDTAASRVIPAVGYRYDVLGRLVELHDAHGTIVRSLEHHDYGNRTATSTGPRLSYQRELGPDPAKGPGEPAPLVFVRRVDFNPRGLATSCWYDEAPTSPHRTSFVYDRAGRLLEEHHPGDRQLHYERDDAGRIVRTTSKFPSRRPTVDWQTFDASNATHSVRTSVDVQVVTYGLGGEVVEQETSDGRKQRSVFDRAGRLIRRESEHASGWVVDEELTYDALDRLVRRTAGSDRVQTFTYTNAGRSLAWSVVDRGSQQQWDLTYDWEGRITSFRQQRYTAVNVGLLPERVRLTYGYDGFGRLKTKTYTDTNDAPLAYLAYRHKGPVQVYRRTWVKTGSPRFDWSSTYEVDADLRLRRIAGPSNDDFYFSYNRAGLLRRIERPRWDYNLHDWRTGNETIYTHDSRGRLVRIVEQAQDSSVISRRDLAYDPRTAESWEPAAAWDPAQKGHRSDLNQLTAMTYHRDFMLSQLPSPSVGPTQYTQDYVRDGDGQVLGAVTRALIPGRRALVDSRRTDVVISQHLLRSHRDYGEKDLVSGVETSSRYMSSTITSWNDHGQVQRISSIRIPPDARRGQARMAQINTFDAHHQLAESWFLQEDPQLTGVPATLQDHKAYLHDAAGRLVWIDLLQRTRPTPNPPAFDPEDAGGAGDSQYLRVRNYYAPDGEPMLRTVAYYDEHGGYREANTLLVTEGSSTVAELDLESGQLRYFETIPAIGAVLAAHTLYASGSRTERLYYRRDHNGVPALLTTGGGDVAVDYLVPAPDGQQDLFGGIDNWPREYLLSDPDAFAPRATPWEREQEYSRYYQTVDPRLDLVLGRLTEWQARALVAQAVVGRPEHLGAARNDHGFRPEQPFQFFSPDMAPLGAGYSTIESLWQGMVDRVRGFADTLTVGLTAQAREAIWGRRLGGVVDHTNYTIGSLGGALFLIVASSVTGGGTAGAMLRAGALIEDLASIGMSAYAVRHGSATWLDHIVGAPLLIPMAIVDELGEQLCFPAGTLVTTSERRAPIETLRPGQVVIAGDGASTQARTVRETFTHTTAKLIVVTVEDAAQRRHAIRSTPSQPWFVSGRGWVRAAELAVGEQLLGIDGSNVVIASLEVEVLEAPVPVFNLEVDHDHSYFVSGSPEGPSLLVHNIAGFTRIARLKAEAASINASWHRPGPRGRGRRGRAVQAPPHGKINTRRFVPGNRNGAFDAWFDTEAVNRIEALWRSSVIRAAIERRTRYPGGLHECLPVARLPRYKTWGLRMDVIKTIRTDTATTRWFNPDAIHGGVGSGAAHRQILNLIDQSDDLSYCLIQLRRWLIHRAPPEDCARILRQFDELL